MTRDELLSYIDECRREKNGVIDLMGENLSGLNLRGINLSAACLRKCNLSHSCIMYSDLSFADLFEADLRDTIFICCGLTGVEPERTIMARTYLRHCDVDANLLSSNYGIKAVDCVIVDEVETVEFK